MKRIRLFIPAAVLTIIFGCSSTKNTTSVPDDVYYSSGDKAADPQPASAVTPSEPSNYSTGTTNYQPDQTSQYSQSYEESQPQSNSEQHNDGNGNTYITNNYYNDDDYYDYQYSARLKRYYSPAIGYGYYDPFYTNSYWYDYNPYDYGVSIYLGYNWWAPSYCYYDPFWYGPVNPHFHNHYYGYYDYWYSPYGYYGYNDYWNGYHDGYWNGYYNGYYAGTYNNPYYYNSYDVNSTYYGPRGSISANGRTTIPSPRATLGEKYQKALVDHKNPILNPKGADGVHTIPVSGIGRGNTTSGTIPVGSKTETRPVHPKDDIHDVKNPVTTEPIRNPISVKNETGGKNDFSTKPNLDPSSYSTPVRGGTTGINQDKSETGGSVRPDLNQPVRTNENNFSRPKNTDITVNPRGNHGGAVRPQEEQPRNIQTDRPRTQEPVSNIPQRNEQVNPRITSPKVDFKNEQPRSNPSFERPRQEIVPHMEQRQEPRQYKQEIQQPRRQEMNSAPAQRQQNFSEPAPRKQSSSNENKSGGRRK